MLRRMTNLKTMRRQATLAYSRHNRQRKADFALDFVRQRRIRSVLLVGVSSYNAPHENIVENAIIAAGLDVTPTGIAEDVQGWDGYVVADGCDLPYEDKSFDLVYSNAVVEHVGLEPEQRQFISEHDRVGQHWIVTTPNRWFPIESHTDILFKHWRPGWNEATVTRLVGRAEFARMLPRGRVRGAAWAPTLTATSD